MKAILATIYCVIHTLILWIPERILWLIGLFVVPVALLFAKDKPGTELPNGWALRQLPWWAYLWSNKDDGSLGDKEGNWAHKDLERHDFSRARKFWSQYRWLALRNPVHNLCLTWLYNANFNRIKSINYAGGYDVDNRYNEDVRSVKSGFNVVWASGSWLYLRCGINLIKRWGNSDRCLRIRLGYKVLPKHCDGLRPDRVTWTMTISPRKMILSGW